MSGLGHHLLKRGIDATQEHYRSSSNASVQDGEGKPFGHPQVVAAALVVTLILWFFSMSIVSKVDARFLNSKADAR